jgi:polar amino acid transport system substrate-binding protein
MKKVSIIAFVLFLSSALSAQVLSFGFRVVPPYVMVDKDGLFSGIEYDIIAAALAARGYSIKPSPYPLERFAEGLAKGEIQAAAPVASLDGGGAILSSPYIAYNNVAISLKRRELSIKSCDDLKGLSIVAFPTARKVLGPDFAMAVEGNAHYVEEADQSLGIRSLFGDLTDVVIGEARILNWFIKTPAAGLSTDSPVQTFSIFPPTNYSAVFADPAVAAAFNEGLKVIRASGRYARIVAKYTK